MPDKSKRILIVENDIDALSLIYTTLLPLDFELEAAVDSSEVRLRLERFKPHLVLLGSNLGGIDAQELCEWIKKNYKARVIGIGFCTVLRPSTASGLCLDEVLEKPVHPEELLLKLSHLLTV